MGGEELETAQLWRGSFKHFTVNGLVTGTGSVIKRIRPFFLTLEELQYVCSLKKK